MREERLREIAEPLEGVMAGYEFSPWTKDVSEDTIAGSFRRDGCRLSYYLRVRNEAKGLPLSPISATDVEVRVVFLDRQKKRRTIYHTNVTSGRSALQVVQRASGEISAALDGFLH